MSIAPESQPHSLMPASAAPSPPSSQAPDVDALAIPDCVYRLTVQQYHTMVDAGCFDSDELARPKLELLEGVLVTMSPIRPPHRLLVDELMYWALDHLDRREFRVSVQNPIEIPSSNSEPEPDLVVFRPYEPGMRHASEQDLLLIIEVAETSLVKDLGQKLRVYASAGVPEYWVVDIPGRQLHVHRRPQGDCYDEVAVLPQSESASPLIDEKATLDLSKLFAVLDVK